MYCKHCGVANVNENAVMCIKCGCSLNDNTKAKFCKHCGTQAHENAVVCAKCGCSLISNSGKSEKDWITTLLLAFFLGGFGGHRFYVGKTGTAIVQLLTLGGCGIWALIDLIIIIMGNFTDAEGKVISKK